MLGNTYILILIAIFSIIAGNSEKIAESLIIGFLLVLFIVYKE